MKAYEITKGVYWVGAIDWNVRNFHGYETKKGSTYNAYLIVDEKIAIFDTVKAPFAAEMLERVKSVVDLDRVDYIISNHVEMDHTGALPVVAAACKNAQIITSTPAGIAGLKAHYGDLGYVGVKTGDSLSLGKKTVKFVQTPMVHWPDSMVSYIPEDEILFSNDAFGQHYASSERMDEEVPEIADVFRESDKYYANIAVCRTRYGGVKRTRRTAHQGHLPDARHYVEKIHSADSGAVRETLRPSGRLRAGFYRV